MCSPYALLLSSYNDEVYKPLEYVCMTRRKEP